MTPPCRRIMLLASNGGSVQAFLKQHPGLQIDIEDGRVRLVHLFRANYWNKPAPQQIETYTYRKLIAFAEQSNAQAQLANA